MQPHTRLDPCLLLLGILQYMVDHGPWVHGSGSAEVPLLATTRAVLNRDTVPVTLGLRRAPRGLW